MGLEWVWSGAGVALEWGWMAQLRLWFGIRLCAACVVSLGERLLAKREHGHGRGRGRECGRRRGWLPRLGNNCNFTFFSRMEKWIFIILFSVLFSTIYATSIWRRVRVITAKSRLTLMEWNKQGACKRNETMEVEHRRIYICQELFQIRFGFTVSLGTFHYHGTVEWNNSKPNSIHILCLAIHIATALSINRYWASSFSSIATCFKW